MEIEREARTATDIDPDDIAALQAIVEATAQTTGQEFFNSVVRNLAAAINVQYAFVAEFTEVTSRVRTRAFWARDRIADNIEYDLAGTPCDDVVRGALCHHPSGIRESFPDDHALSDMGIESYLGHLAVFDQRPMPQEPRRLFVFKIFAARAAAELQRLRMEKALSDSEQRFRDLFDEAPIAYVLEDTETRFVKANQAAIKLRVLQEHELDRIGARAPIQVDVRVIAATNRNLASAVRNKEFREDLFYRLNVFPIQLPPLRERAGDVPLLAYYFVSRFAAQLGKHIDGIQPATMERLVSYPWPGNIRELENVIERAVILCRKDILEVDPMMLQGSSHCSSVHPTPASRDSDNSSGTSAESLEGVERNHIR